MTRSSLSLILIGCAAALACGCERSQPAPTTPPDDTARTIDGDGDGDGDGEGADGEADIETVQVSGNIYMLVGKGGNIGVSAGDDGVVIIDDKFAPLAPKIKAAYEALPHKGTLRYVLNTHFHGDHTGGNEIFGQEATIIAHDNVRARLAADSSPPGALPVLTFGKDLTVHFNGEAIHAVHFPHGHTDTDSVIFFDGSNVVHMGDHFFNGRFPYVDIDHGGTVRGMRANVRSILEQVKPDTKIIPGHGPLATAENLKAYLAMLDETSAFVEAKIKAGKSLNDIQRGGLPAKWKAWSGDFINTERWIATLHRELTAAQ